LATGWLVVFLYYFFSLELPNSNGYPRSQVWLELPKYLGSALQFGANSGWRFLPQRLDLWLVAGCILAGAWSIGHLLLRPIDLGLPRRCCERTVFAFALGLSALSLLTLGLGLAGWLSQVLFGALIGIAIVAEVLLRLRSSAADRRADTVMNSAAGGADAATAGPTLKAACLVAMLPFLLAMALGAALPSVDFDVNEYHLQGPKEFYQAGRITFLPHNVYTSFPFLTEMLSLLAMVLRGDWFRGALAGKTVLMMFAPLTALALYTAGRRWFHPAAGWLAATIYLTTPWTVRISTIALTEGGLACYLLVTLLASVIAVEQLRRRGSASGMCLVAGLLAGSAMACKYPGVLSVVIPAGLLIAAASLMRPRSGASAADAHSDAATAGQAGQRFKPALVFTLGVTLTIGPWLLKNLVQTGNPVYPLMYTVFGGADWDNDLNVKWRNGHRPDDYKLSKLPFWITDVSARNDWLSPLLYGFAPLAFLWTRHRKGVGSLWLYVAWLFATWWLFTHRIDRFWVPMLPVVALLAGAGAAWSARPAWILISTACLAACVLFNLEFVVSGAAGYNAYLADLDYARKWTAANYAPAIAHVNQQFEEGDRVLCVGEAQVFDAEFPLVYNTAFDRSIFQEWFAAVQPGVADSDLELRPADEIRSKLAKEGITHILVNWMEVLRYRRTYGHSEFVTPERFTALEKAGVLGPARMPRNLEFDSLDKKDQREIERWAPRLKANVRGQTAFIAIQVYPVIRPETSD